MAIWCLLLDLPGYLHFVEAEKMDSYSSFFVVAKGLMVIMIMITMVVVIVVLIIVIV